MYTRVKNRGSELSSTPVSLPLVSVIIPYYVSSPDQKDFILETVLSVKQQTYPNIELIVIDDGSPIPAAPVLTGIEDIQLLRTENAGAPAARNFGFERSSGQYLVFLDGDDLLSADAIEKNLEALVKHPEASLSFGAVRLINEHGDEICPSRACRARWNYFWLLLETNPIWSSGSTLIRREAFVQAGLFRDFKTFQVDDYELYLKLSRVGTFVQHTSCVLEYRRHGNNMSNNRKRMLVATLEVLQRVADEENLTAFERLQLRRGRRRWKYAFRDDDRLITRFMNRYYRYTSVWNLRGDLFLREMFERTIRKCGSEPTHFPVKSKIVSTGIEDTQFVQTNR